MTRYFFSTETGSEYVYDDRAHTLKRGSTTPMRGDFTNLPVLRATAPLVEGHPAQFILNLPDHGVVTSRTTSTVTELHTEP